MPRSELKIFNDVQSKDQEHEVDPFDRALNEVGTRSAASMFASAFEFKEIASDAETQHLLREALMNKRG